MKIDATGVKLVDIFEKKYIYEIPDYQRPYSWTKDEIDDLFNDLINSINSNSSHYFGAFVFNTERRDKEKIIEVIDGQQRLTTVCIFLYVIRSIYEMLDLQTSEQMGKVNYRKSTLMQYLHLLNEDGEPVGPKLILGDPNKEFFHEYIVKGWDKDKAYKEKIINQFRQMNKYEISKTISTAYDIIYNNLVNNIKGLAEEKKFSVIKEYQDKLLNNFEVVKIEVGHDSDAFLIFETLNDRGLELSAIDLIKNRLFKNCAKNSDFEEIKNKWTEMTTCLEDVSLIKKFLKHYWISNYDHTTNQNLFISYRDKVKNDPKISKNLIYDLNKTSYDYYDINYPRQSSISNKKLINVLDDMNSLGYDLTHPIILSGFKKFRDDEEELYKLVKLCLNFMVRYITIMKGKPSAVEKEIGKCARTFTDIHEVAETFKSFSKDSEFKEHFKTVTMNPRSQQTYYLLVEYEKSLHTNETWVTPGRKDVTIEHVLPRTVKFDNGNLNKDEWASIFTKEDWEVYVNRLGNLTLLGTKGQLKVSNKKFDEKKKLYQTYTDMKSTLEIASYSKWTKEYIEKRQGKMAEEAVDIFTLDVDKIR